MNRRVGFEDRDEALAFLEPAPVLHGGKQCWVPMEACSQAPGTLKEELSKYNRRELKVRTMKPKKRKRR